MQRCPECDETISSEAMNITEGVALCPVCRELSHLSDLIWSDRTADEILSRPPSGCSIREADDGVVVTASLRSVGGALGIGFFALFWNSIVSIFVFVAIAGLYSNLIGPLPAWFPAPGLQDGKPRMNDQPMDLGMTLFMCIFLLPFVLVGLGTIGSFLLLLLGKIEVLIGEHDSYAATGIGPLLWKRRFDATQVKSVKYGRSKSQSDDSNFSKTLVITADLPISTASMLPQHRMEWLRIVLKELLLNPNDHRYRATIPYPAWLDHRRASRPDLN